MELLDIGNGNLVNASKIVAVLGASSAPARRIVKSASANNKLIDASSGKKTESVIITDSDHVILSPLLPEQLSSAMK